MRIFLVNRTSGTLNGLCRYYMGTILFLLLNNVLFAQNPLIQDQFTADPTARVFDDTVYIYPSHDIMCTEDKGKPGWFCMEDYHVFSSKNLTAWKDHGVILTQKDVSWADPQAYSMWAPDCIEKEGLYYFYFPTKSKESGAFKIGVAVGKSPVGPFISEKNPIENVDGIDPNVFMDTDGQAYLYWSGKNIYVAKLKPNLKELASEPVVIANLPEEGHMEGPFMFERNGNYYLTYPHVEDKTERLEYAMGDNPMGPFRVTGVLMDESATGCWTNHHSIVAFKKQWYLFYHHNDLSPDFDKNRSIRADSLTFNPDGSIQKVVPTLRGIGVSAAADKIEIDRYSKKSNHALVRFNDSQKPFKGWNIALEQEDWVHYNSVQFDEKYSKIILYAHAEKASVLSITDAVLKSTIAEIQIAPGDGWERYEIAIAPVNTGRYDLLFSLKKGKIAIDWVQFK